jgi:type II secretory pathway predicted ATPase ExeA
MYRSFFGLTDLPFRSTPDLDYFFQAADREDIVTAIEYALERGDGIIKVVGEVGSGKTTLLRRLSQKLPLHYRIVYINSPNLSPHDTLFFICHEFGLDVNSSEPKFFLSKKLREYFLEQHANGLQPLLLIDEAQAIPIDTLEELRLLLNLETDQHKLVQIVLFGQPELDSNLNKPQIRQFLSRISHSLSLPAFTVEDVKSYLNFRMHKAGFKGSDLFTDKIARLIHKQSHGYPREIHGIADRALLSAFSDGSTVLKPHHIETKVKRFFGLKSVLTLLLIVTFFFILIIFFLNRSFFHSLSESNFFIGNNSSIESEQTLNTEVKLEVKSVPEFEIQNSKKDPVLIQEPKEIHVPDSTIQVNKLNFLNNHDRQMQEVYTRFEASPDIRYSIQLITSDLQELEEAITRLTRSAGLDRNLLFYSLNTRGDKFTLYYGLYSGFSLARAQMETLPALVQRDGPFIIGRDQVLTELNQYKTSGLVD